MQSGYLTLSLLQDKNLKLDKDLDPSISDMQDIMRNIKKKKNDLYDKTTIEFVDVSFWLRLFIV